MFFNASRGGLWIPYIITEKTLDNAEFRVRIIFILIKNYKLFWPQKTHFSQNKPSQFVFCFNYCYKIENKTQTTVGRILSN